MFLLQWKTFGSSFSSGINWSLSFKLGSFTRGLCSIFAVPRTALQCYAMYFSKWFMRMDYATTQWNYCSSPSGLSRVLTHFRSTLFKHKLPTVGFWHLKRNGSSHLTWLSLSISPQMCSDAHLYSLFADIDFTDLLFFSLITLCLFFCPITAASMRFQGADNFSLQLWYSNNILKGLCK